MFYRSYRNEILSSSSVTTADSVLTEETKCNYDYPVFGWYWFESDEQAKAHFIELDALESRLIEFARERDIDIQEIPMLLNSTNQEWKSEAVHFQTLYLASWKAFYSNEPLPALVW
jgi:hypothetical protein